MTGEVTASFNAVDCEKRQVTEASQHERGASRWDGVGQGGTGWDGVCPTTGEGHRHRHDGRRAKKGPCIVRVRWAGWRKGGRERKGP